MLSCQIEYNICVLGAHMSRQKRFTTIKFRQLGTLTNLKFANFN